MLNIIKRFFFLFSLVLFVAGCGTSERSITEDQATIEYDLLYDLPKQTISFNEQVLPVLEKRCVSCHACYDAPCQLKLSSTAGIHRGASKEIVYDGARITPADPTRLFIDAVTTAEWRDKGFDSVLYERGVDEVNSPARNLENSVMYRMLRLKQLHPQARTGMLSDKFDLGLNRKQSCPTIDEFEEYAQQHPEGGMPFAMPNLSREEYKTLVHWIAQGAPVEAEAKPSTIVQPQIDAWEDFLNRDSLKAQLVSRYLYEHLFQASLHFEGGGEREFYRLIRSTTPPGEPAKVIASRRPYGEVDGKFFYRILRRQGSIVAKQHTVYELSEKRMQRLQALFYDTDYAVNELPSYAPEVASNPIKAFAQIPVKSRYKFLLDDARFFIEGFIKGPVCRGQIALNVIEDQFWVFFFDPDAPTASADDEFLINNADNLASPSELEDTFNLLSVNLHYKGLFQNYIRQRDKEAEKFETVSLPEAMPYLWDGDGHTNRNAALTIFRHFDSASVNYGMLGDYPDTAWVLDYSVLERIHYLLVAGFDVYGNVGHQLNTRLYMDLLRTEGENFFLVFLPVETRHQLIDEWYQGIRASNKGDQGDVHWINKQIVNGYSTDDPQRELYAAIENYLGKLAGDGDYINRCADQDCVKPTDEKVLRVDRAMREAAKMDGRIVQFLPDLAFVRVLMGGEEKDDRAYSMISNKAYKSVSSMLQTEHAGVSRDYEFDTQTVLPWLEGSYPSFFYVVELDEIEEFVEQYNAISDRQEYEQFVMRFGIRRTHEDFWKHADWFNDYYRRDQPLASGIFDLNRYLNR